ncbi:hypothetical protein MMC27_008762 [Xylographa pallens]|nr:hypothetical protein [Xylographa pallens]
MARKSHLFAATAALLPYFSNAIPMNRTARSDCRYIPDDTKWPSSQIWNDLNTTIGGKLIMTVSLGTPCHDPNYNESACDYLKEQWDLAPVHIQSPSSIMQPWFQNGTCDPFHSESQSCTLGNEVEYSINASDVNDVIAGVTFAQKNNIRLAIKNTGHDFAGKSTAKYGLGIWTHNLNQIDILSNYISSTYSGVAMKMGAGTLAAAAYEAAHSINHRVVGGNCPTVGLAGGYNQGGGHSALSSIYGLAADNVLEWEIVTANGTHTVASPSQNIDLFWALSGGGGGTYAVVISMTTKMYPDAQVGGASFSFNTSSTSPSAYWTAINQLQQGLGAVVDTGATFLYEITNSSFLAFMSAPLVSPAQISSLLKYSTDHLEAQSIPYTLSITTDPTYYAHYDRYYGPLPDGIWQVSHLIGSRLIPRTFIQENSSALTAAYQNITASGDFTVVSIALNASNPTHSVSENSVHPAWRTALLHTLAYSPWDWSAPREVMQAREEVLTAVIEPQLVGLTPDSGTYLNEANFQMRNNQHEFFGPNLQRLREIKKINDPHDLFYGKTAVGNEAWIEDSSGRLCRA